jgi:hypothetical protein
MNTCVFGQHDPGKIPMGKLVREIDIYRRSQTNATMR